MPPALWGGAVSFGMVNGPVKLAIAPRDHAMRFSQSHKQDDEKISIGRTCPAQGEIPAGKSVKGTPVGKHEYVVVTPQERKSLEPAKSHTTDVEESGGLVQVDPACPEKPHRPVQQDTGAMVDKLIKERAEDWEPQTYQDAFRERVLERVERTTKGKTLKGMPRSGEPAVVQGLEAALEASLRDIGR